MINAGERLIVNNCSFGYLSHRIVFYLTNLHIKTRHTYFARVSRGAFFVEREVKLFTDVCWERLGRCFSGRNIQVRLVFVGRGRRLREEDD